MILKETDIPCSHFQTFFSKSQVVRVAHGQLEHPQLLQSFMEQLVGGLAPDLCPQTHAQARFGIQLGTVNCVRVQIPISLEH